MPDIFISYKRQDRPWAEALAQALEATGRSVWWDDRLAAGEQYDEVLETQLEQTRCVIVLWSAASIESRWVRTEANEGLRRNILVPVKIEDVEPPLAFRLIHTGSLIGWDRTAAHPLLADLVQDVNRMLGQPAAARAPAPNIVTPTSPVLTDEHGMQFVRIEPGVFTMGSADGDHHERPEHPVSITRPFYIGIHPVTQAQYEAVIGTNPSTFKKGGDYPVEKVSWKDAQRFIDYLNASDGAYRLPTEAEWEYACRAGSRLPYSFGFKVTDLPDHAWFADNAGGGTHPVGQKAPNAWGLYDMHGNVWEWVADWHAAYTEAAAKDPTGPEKGSHKVVRGGSWNDRAKDLRSFSRYNYSQTVRFHVVGFRLVRER